MTALGVICGNYYTGNLLEGSQKPALPNPATPFTDGTTNTNAGVIP